MVERNKHTTTLKGKMKFQLSPDEHTTLATYNTIAEEWDKINLYSHWKDHSWYTFVDSLKPKSSIIDLGCGTAQQTSELVLSEGFNYFGIDISEKMVAVAKKNLTGLPGITDKSLQCMDMRDLRFANETFDGFLSITSFMHLPRGTLRTALQEVHRVLRTKGRGLISISQGTYEGLYTPDASVHPVYVVCWQTDQMRKMFADTGFNILLEDGPEHMLVYVVERQ